MNMSKIPCKQIRARLMAMLNDGPETIVPALRTKVLEAHVKLTPDMPGEAVGPVCKILKNDAVELAYAFGRDDLASELGHIVDTLERTRRDCTDTDGSRVSEIYIDFVRGTGTISCEDCSAADVADALTTVARALQAVGETPSYIGFDEGKICAGDAKEG